MPIDGRIKNIAYKLDPECWVSYSGKPIPHKRYMEGRRAASLELAAKVRFRKVPKPRGEIVINISQHHMPPLKIKMMLHFYAVVGPFAPEVVRRSEAYSQYVRELLSDGMIERPSHSEREQHEGWAYRATEKGRVYVNALTQVPMPIQVPVEPVKMRWAMPASDGTVAPETAMQALQRRAAGR